MRRLTGEQARWAEQSFGHTELGDGRRTKRLVRMATRAAQTPGGKVSEVIENAAELQGAYDFLETGHVAPAAMLKALGKATLCMGSGEPYMFASVDGSSVKLTDRARTKDFGSIGSHGSRGLKVISALALTPDGVPIGLCAQTWWARTDSKKRSPLEKQRRKYRRKTKDKETGRWLDTITDCSTLADQADARLWFLLDREGDNQEILLRLGETEHRFTVRSSWNRLIESSGHDTQYLRQRLALEAPLGSYPVQLGRQHNRRTAHMVVRHCKVVLRLIHRRSRKVRQLEVTAVWTREEGTQPDGEEPLDWLLLTNAPVESLQDARHIVFGYTLRWRVEEFHKTWKSGACNVEASQLRGKTAAMLWAIILAAVAARIERIKALARKQPSLPASVVLSSHEIKALILLKRQQKKRTEAIPDAMPTIGQATIWIAELGGYTGKSSGGPPGAITIRRGLEKIVPAAQALAALAEHEGRSDQ